LAIHSIPSITKNGSFEWVRPSSALPRMKAEFGRALECAAADVEQRVTGGPKSDRPGQAANGGIGGDLDLLRLDQADPGHAAGYLDHAVERRGAALEGDDPPLASTVIRCLRVSGCVARATCTRGASVRKTTTSRRSPSSRTRAVARAPR